MAGSKEGQDFRALVLEKAFNAEETRKSASEDPESMGKSAQMLEKAFNAEDAEETRRNAEEDFIVCHGRA